MTSHVEIVLRSASEARSGATSRLRIKVAVIHQDHFRGGSMSKFIKALGFIFVGVSASVSADTVSEIKQVLLDNIQFTNQELKQDPMRISKKGSKEFFSSGGLLNEISRNTTDNTFVSFSGNIKHVDITVIVEGQAAVAHYYQEAVMQPQGSAKVPDYRTRVTQVFVKEDGEWKIRAAHWSPLVGGAGTSQTVVR